MDDDGYRFAHALVREAVYSATPKAVRAELHERFADRLDDTAGTGVGELDEIRGYHLEQAHQLRREITTPDEHTRDLGARAARLLGAAGRRALARGDFPRQRTCSSGRSHRLLPAIRIACGT